MKRADLRRERIAEWHAEGASGAVIHALCLFAGEINTQRDSASDIASRLSSFITEVTTYEGQA